MLLEPCNMPKVRNKPIRPICEKEPNDDEYETCDYSADHVLRASNLIVQDFFPRGNIRRVVGDLGGRCPAGWRDDLLGVTPSIRRGRISIENHT